MKQQIKKINFKDENTGGFQFDFVNFEDLLNKTPADHNQFKFHKVFLF